MSVRSSPLRPPLPSRDVVEGGGGRGGGTQKCVYPKWPDQMFPTEFIYCYLFIYHSSIYYHSFILESDFKCRFFARWSIVPLVRGGGGGGVGTRPLWLAPLAYGGAY